MSKLLELTKNEYNAIDLFFKKVPDFVELRTTEHPSVLFVLSHPRFEQNFYYHITKLITDDNIIGYAWDGSLNTYDSIEELLYNIYIWLVED